MVNHKDTWGVLLQGTELHQWEHQRQQAQLTATLQQKEEELRRLRNGSRVILGEVDVPEDEKLDKEVRFREQKTSGSIQEYLSCTDSGSL